MTVDWSLIVQDNEQTAQKALEREDYVSAFLLIHALVESILRIFLSINGNKAFSLLIKKFEAFLGSNTSGKTTFVKELKEFNRRRNRIIHQLWQKGYTFTNLETKDTAIGALLMYSLLIEFVETFDSELESAGFKLKESLKKSSGNGP